MSNNAPELPANLKFLEGNIFNSETALFDALHEAGIQMPKGYRAGSRNKTLARNEAERYIEYKPNYEVDPTCRKRRAVIVTEVFDTPRPKEDGRGARGRYADYLKPLIVNTAMNGPFYGTRAELFDRWGCYDTYRGEQIRNRSFDPQKGYSFSPWRTGDSMQPGEEKYCQIAGFKERNSLETSFDSLGREGVLEWYKYTRFAPMIQTTELVDSIERTKTWDEYSRDCDRRFELVTQLAQEENCVLSPKLFQGGIFVSRYIYEDWCEEYYRSNGEELPNERATEIQEQMYDNYQTFIRQLTIQECTQSKVLCPPDEIPNRFKIFTDWTYRRKYNELDKRLKKELMGWEQVRQELYFKLLDETKALKYLERYSSELAFELGCEYILYMDEHMEKEKLYYPPKYTSDYYGVISSKGSDRLFPLDSSRSAKSLHKKLKRLYRLE